MINYLSDTHAHIYKEYYDNIDEIINKAQKNSIKYIINSGCDDLSNKEVLATSLKYENVYCTLGIHPENVEKYQEEDLNFISKNINNKKVVAIGEIGLDYFYSKYNKEKQIKLFEKQLAIAEANDIPVVIHSREATLDTITCLKKFKVHGVIHSFTGSLEIANTYIHMGFYLGINGVITFKNSNIKDIYKNIDINRILLETDSPYLTPHPYRGTTNDSSKILVIANFVADLYNISLSQLSEITNRNMRQIFDKIV